MRLTIFTTFLLTLHLVAGQMFQCVLENINSSQVEQCVFRDVNLGNATASAMFSYPSGVPKPTHVAFKDSNMSELPPHFLNLAGSDLKVLRVENCGLQSVTISSGLEALYAKDNQIESVIVHQSGPGGPLQTLDLGGNKLTEIGNVTKCQLLETLILSGNSLSYILEFNKFKGMNNLRKLDLAQSEINYVDNTGNINLESLEDLDLSNNIIIPSDFDLTIFYHFPKLNTLRLNDNFMSMLDYNLVINIKLLKTIYLNGNNFECSYLQIMLQYFQQNNINTPLGGPYSCKTNLDGFCCFGQFLPKTSTPSLPKTTTEDVEPQTNRSNSFLEYIKQHFDGYF